MARIKSDKYSQLIARIRSTSDKVERDNQKKTLPAVLFSGTFSKRLNSALEQHSGLVVLDFDKLGAHSMEVRQRLQNEPYTVLLFTSPSGDGLKCVFRIPNLAATHADSCRAIRKHFQDEPAYDHFQDVARICFMSYDPEAYYNPEAEVFEELIEAPKPQVIEVHQVVSDYDQVYTNLKTWLTTKRGEHYTDGNKHKFLVQLASACNRFGIPEHETLAKLKYDFLGSASAVDEADYDRIVRKVYTLYRSQHATSFFDSKQVIYQRSGTVKTEYVSVEEMPELPTDLAKDVIYVDSIRPQLKDIFHNGFKKASSTYYLSIDHHWRWKKGEVSLMSGIMNHGKSTLMLQLMLIKSMKERAKWAVFSPEQNPPDEFYLDLAHTMLGKSTFGDYSNKCTEDELDSALDFLQSHFFFIYPQNESPTPDYINERFLEVITKHRVEGCMIDPYNQLDNDIQKKGGREDQYLAWFLSKQKRFALDHNVYMNLVAHPNSGLEKVKTGAPNVGNYECPDIFNLAGGAMWGNMCDNILFTYRPYYSTDPSNTQVIFKSVKIKKQKLVGVPGSVYLDFNRKQNRYFGPDQECPFPEVAAPAPIKHNPYTFLKSDQPNLEFPECP